MLNVESEHEGGMRAILQHLLEFFKAHPGGRGLLAGVHVATAPGTATGTAVPRSQLLTACVALTWGFQPMFSNATMHWHGWDAAV